MLSKSIIQYIDKRIPESPFIKATSISNFENWHCDQSNITGLNNFFFFNRCSFFSLFYVPTSAFIILIVISICLYVVHSKVQSQMYLYTCICVKDMIQHKQHKGICNLVWRSFHLTASTSMQNLAAVAGACVSKHFFCCFFN